MEKAPGFAAVACAIGLFAGCSTSGRNETGSAPLDAGLAAGGSAGSSAGQTGGAAAGGGSGRPPCREPQKIAADATVCPVDASNGAPCPTFGATCETYRSTSWNKCDQPDIVVTLRCCHYGWWSDNGCPNPDVPPPRHDSGADGSDGSNAGPADGDAGRQEAGTGTISDDAG